MLPLYRERHSAIAEKDLSGVSYCYSIDNIRKAIDKIGEFVEELKGETWKLRLKHMQNKFNA